MVYYFAYGSNLSEKQIRKRCPDSRLIEKAVLKRYRFDFRAYSESWKCCVADIVQDEKKEVWGLIYEVNDNNLRNLYTHEGHPTFYKRVKVKVINEQGEGKEVFVYEVVHKKPFIKPSKKYINIIKDAAKQHKFPEDYIKYLEDIETI